MYQENKVNYLSPKFDLAQICGKSRQSIEIFGDAEKQKFSSISLHPKFSILRWLKADTIFLNLVRAVSKEKTYSEGIQAVILFTISKSGGVIFFFQKVDFFKFDPPVP